ncbi:aminotransferase class III-fold pyridoxal phosphate-dependent enzyme [Streptomyces sp. NBC_00006]|uniref:aminotransferase class III-fold pyridoxal phosphate-dependent enzyme n=1 Tax=Streptomyces sp. NBC_00006 TaxID=2975619 RepID=UPI00225622EB|nr:aminotransferase class III-fold pyridoxal phosphate-dependent enzyme [Streptomyces sp. NBC_00006]MCX5529759.1 aminotransferase class III-fold pyridoxal phosphate-dependent enzyme [Streptomyces sp. NBC_00006]
MQTTILSALAADLFDVHAEAVPLPGEATDNTRLDVEGRPQYLLKMYAADTSPAEIELQEALLTHLARTESALPTASLVATSTATVAGHQRTAHLLEWIPGTPYSQAGPADARRLHALGSAVATLDGILAGFEHSALDRDFRWHPLRAGDLARALPHVGDGVRDFTASTLARLGELMPELRALPQQAIHNDANDNNVLLDADGRIAAIIDFGDVVRAPRVCGLAVAAAYAQLGQDDPVAAACAVVAGYHAEAPLSATELRLLPDLINARLAMSIANSVEQLAADPDNAYLDSSQPQIRELVTMLSGEPHEVLVARFRDACGYRPVPTEREIVAWLRSAGCDPAPMLRTDPATARIHTIDWTAHGPADLHIRHGAPSVGAAIDAHRTAHGGTLTIGRYREDRVVYRSDAFAGGRGGERRSVHMAIDVFDAAGAPVFAPFDGTVKAVEFRGADYDYGGVVLLEHRTGTSDGAGDGTPFWLLVGHLDRRSVEQLRAGDTVRRGDTIGRLGAAAENGGWPPHIHVQLFTTLLGRSTDLPGAVRPSEADVWESICPNPNLVLRAPGNTAVAPDRRADQIAARRTANLSPTLSLSYAEPLHITAGEGAELIDVHGRRYLDLVNNVCHVGHSHPHVVGAIAEQAARLNTNTRYLHANITEYARRLAATFPDPLNVVMLTNSGSEANDLALRLARTATGREHVLTLDWAYHGNLSSLVEISPYKFNRSGGTGPGERVRVCDIPDPYRGAFGSDGARYAEHLRTQCAGLSAAGTGPAAFIHESIPGCAGQVELADGYLPAAYAEARAAGALCIADEVQCGFGRVGEHMWAFERHGVVPDIVTLGKPIGNGHPIAAVVTTPEVARRFRTGMEYFNTFGGNPVSCAAALAVLDVVEDERLMANADRVGGYLRRRLTAMAEHHPPIGDVRGRGLFLGADLVVDRDTKEPDRALAKRVVEAAKRDGVLLSTDGPGDNVLKIKPPLVLSMEQARRAADVIERALTEVAAAR